MNSQFDLPAALGKLAAHCVRHRHRVATAESCTGGLLAAACTSIPGSSDWFEGGFVTYRLSAKQRLLGIQPEVLEQHGAVSEIVAKQMVEHTLSHAHADIAVATTGLAGPAGDGTDTDVGTLWIAWAVPTPAGPHITAERFELHVARGPFREAAVELAVAGLLERLAIAN